MLARSIHMVIAGAVSRAGYAAALSAPIGTGRDALTDEERRLIDDAQITVIVKRGVRIVTITATGNETFDPYAGEPAAAPPRTPPKPGRPEQLCVRCKRPFVPEADMVFSCPACRIPGNRRRA